MTGRWAAAASTSRSCAAGCKEASFGRGSDLISEGVGVRWGKAEKYGVVEPRHAERGNGDGRSRGGAEAVDAMNPLWVAVR